MNNTSIAWVELPEQVTAQQIANYFHISRSKVYELMEINPHCGGIPSYRVGTGSKSTRLVDKDDLLMWKESQKAKQNKKWEGATK